MGISFKIHEDSVVPGMGGQRVPIVDVLFDDRTVATIYPDPDDENGIRLVSAYIEEVGENDESESWPRSPNVHIRFDPANGG